MHKSKCTLSSLARMCRAEVLIFNGYAIQWIRPYKTDPLICSFVHRFVDSLSQKRIPTTKYISSAYSSFPLLFRSHAEDNQNHKFSIEFSPRMKRQLLCQIEIQLCGFITFRDEQIGVDEGWVEMLPMQWRWICCNIARKGEAQAAPWCCSFSWK